MALLGRHEQGTSRGRPDEGMSLMNTGVNARIILSRQPCINFTEDTYNVIIVKLYFMQFRV